MSSPNAVVASVLRAGQSRGEPQLLGLVADGSARDQLTLPLVISTELVEMIAAHVATMLATPEPAMEAWLDVTAAARHLGYGSEPAGMRRGRQRIYDLVSQRRVRFAKDGSRLLFRRSWLDDYLEGRGSAEAG
jgi:hypothetical protein